MSGVSKFLLFLATSPSAVAPALAQSGEPIDEIVVVADPLEFLELESSGSVYGLDFSYVQTPRAILRRRQAEAFAQGEICIVLVKLE